MKELNYPKTLDYLTIATCDKEIYNFSKKEIITL